MSSTAPSRDALTINGPAGRIEALLEVPQKPAGHRVAVLCHPHPQHQGTMTNKVLHTLSRSMNALGMPAVASSVEGDPDRSDLVADNAFDGNHWTRWSSEAS